MPRPRHLVAVPLLLAAGLALAACSDASGDPDLGSFTISGSWNFTSGEGAKGDITPLADHPITLVVDDAGKVSGNDGCNSYMSTVAVDGEKVTFEPIAGTQMACDEDVMAVAQAYTQALQGVTKGELDDKGVLELEGEDIELHFDPAS